MHRTEQCFIMQKVRYRRSFTFLGCYGDRPLPYLLPKHKVCGPATGKGQLRSPSSGKDQVREQKQMNNEV